MALCPGLVRQWLSQPARRQTSALRHSLIDLCLFRTSLRPFPASRAASPAIGASCCRLHAVPPAPMHTIPPTLSRVLTPALSSPGEPRYQHFSAILHARSGLEKHLSLRPPLHGLLGGWVPERLAAPRVPRHHRPIQLSLGSPRPDHRKLGPLEVGCLEAARGRTIAPALRIGVGSRETCMPPLQPPRVRPAARRRACCEPGLHRPSQRGARRAETWVDMSHGANLLPVLANPDAHMVNRAS